MLGKASASSASAFLYPSSVPFVSFGWWVDWPNVGQTPSTPRFVPSSTTRRCAIVWEKIVIGIATARGTPTSGTVPRFRIPSRFRCKHPNVREFSIFNYHYTYTTRALYNVISLVLFSPKLSSRSHSLFNLQTRRNWLALPLRYPQRPSQQVAWIRRTRSALYPAINFLRIPILWSFHMWHPST